MVVSEEIKAMSKEELLDIALTTGRILLCNGAETYRVEDTMLRICALGGMNTVSAFCTPSVILLSAEASKGFSRMYRITKRTVNLKVISQINDFSFKLHGMHASYEQILAELQQIENVPKRATYVDIFCAGLLASGFAVVLGGWQKEFTAAFIAAALSMAFLKKLRPFSPSSFWETTIAGAIVCAVSLGFCYLVPGTSVELSTAGAIMPYVPGMAFTNGLRDYIAGDLISGNSRVGEAIFQVGGLVIGVATVLGIFYH